MVVTLSAIVWLSEPRDQPQITQADQVLFASWTLVRWRLNSGGCRKATGRGVRDQQDEVRRRPSRHAEQHAQPQLHMEVPRAECRKDSLDAAVHAAESKSA